MSLGYSSTTTVAVGGQGKICQGFYEIFREKKHSCQGLRYWKSCTSEPDEKEKGTVGQEKDWGERMENMKDENKIAEEDDLKSPYETHLWNTLF